MSGGMSPSRIVLRSCPHACHKQHVRLGIDTSQAMEFSQSGNLAPPLIRSCTVLLLCIRGAGLQYA